MQELPQRYIGHFIMNSATQQKANAQKPQVPDNM